MTPLIVFLALVAVGLLLRAVLPVSLRLATQFSVRDLRSLAKAYEARMLPFMQANYSGDPEQIDSVVRPLLASAREVAAQQPDPVDEGILYEMIVASLAARRFAPRTKAQAALEAVLSAERRAA